MMKKDSINLLLVEDDELTSMLVARMFPAHFNVHIARNSRDVQHIIKREKIVLAFVDLDLERSLEGVEIVKELKQKDIFISVLSSRNENDIIETCFQYGADEYLEKPLSVESLNQVLVRFSSKSVSQDNKILKAALTKAPVLILGETGVGKTRSVAELFKAWKDLQFDKTGDIPFVHINCSEFSESVLESELFGHVKGAFTGAVKDKKGVLELADGGMLFLDEVGTISINMQKKLLKAIEDKEFFPVGSEKSKKVSFKLVSATCESLEQKITLKEMRDDFYHRISAIKIQILPLRERTEEISRLIENYLVERRRKIIFSMPALEHLKKYPWPGNIRELHAFLDNLFLQDLRIINHDLVLAMLPLPQKNVELQQAHENDENSLIQKMGLTNYLELKEKEIVDRFLAKNAGKIRKTIQDLQISNSAFYRITGES